MAKESTCKAGDTGDTVLIPGSGRSPGEGDGNPLQYSCLEDPIYREACGLQSMGLQKSRTRWKRLSMHIQELPNPDLRFLTLVSHLHPTN